ncbi:MAG: hypothetical protein NXY57DRAFT_1040861 [Lentinula lateritia]|nr:MAG: hypothetical protein NXY57DRAFT_1040861 [Lentinula lateritia]
MFNDGKLSNGKRKVRADLNRQVNLVNVQPGRENTPLGPYTLLRDVGRIWTLGQSRKYESGQIRDFPALSFLRNAEVNSFDSFLRNAEVNLFDRLYAPPLLN